MGGSLGSKERVLRILQQLSSGAALTVQDLVDQLNVSSKTIRRDLKAMEKAGIAVQVKAESNRPHEWRLYGNQEQHRLKINYLEAFAICLGLRFSAPIESTFIGDVVRSAESKVRACIGPSALRFLEPLAKSWKFSSPGVSRYSTKSGFMEEIMFALADRRKLEIDYCSAQSKQPKKYIICPYSVAWHKGLLYLYAHSESHGEERIFKLDRMGRVVCVQEAFQLPSDFDPKKAFADSFGVFQGNGDHKITIRFSADAAQYVREGNWHASQTLTDLDNGGVLLSLRLSSTEEIKRWVYSFGSEAVVEKPEALRDEMRQELRVMSSSYEPKSTKRLSASKKGK